MKKKIGNLFLITTMVLGSSANIVSNVFAQDVLSEGDVVLGNTTDYDSTGKFAVNSLEAMKSAEPGYYFDVVDPDDSTKQMRITKLQHDIYHIDECTAAYIADGPTNNGASIYLVIGDNRADIIDGGNGEDYSSHFSDNILKEIFDTLAPNGITSAVITHSHGDHTGLFRDETKNGYKVLGQDVVIKIHKDDLSSLASVIRDGQCKIETFEDNDKISVGNRTLTVYGLKAHTEGSCALLDEEDHVLFSGDALGSGTVWLQSDENQLVDLKKGVDELVEIVKDMPDLACYTGHRWQEAKGDAHSNGIAVQEVGLQHILEYQALLNNIAADNYEINADFIPAGGNSDYAAIYSLDDDLNNDGYYPGIYVRSIAAIKKLQEETGSSERALNSIIIPRYEADGTKTQQHISTTLKSHLSVKDINKIKDAENNTITVDVQLVGVNLVSEYKNCVGEPGTSYYNMLSYYANVLQVKELVDKNEGYTIIDSKGNMVDATYVNELVGLLKQINDFDPTTDLQYDWDSAYDTEAFATETYRGGTDVIATSKERNVTLKFHIDAHGWWGYDIGMHDSITGVVMGYDADYAYQNQHDLTTQYGNFFVIKMKEDDAGTWYMLRNTDLENPMIYVSKDGKEAFMIDVDFYGQNVLNRVIKSVIGDKCESLKIFCTHNHLDHCDNLAIIAQDERLKEITTMYWPENEPHATLNGIDVVAAFPIKTLSDMEKFTVAGVEFQFIEIPNEHTPGGGQLADLTHKVIYSGDSLGAQIQYGGTNFYMSNAQNWLLGAQKAANYIVENEIRYNIGGHTPYLNNPEYATWVATAIQYAYDQIQADSSWSGGLVIVENGEVVSAQRAAQLQSEGLTDREVLNVCSITFRNNLTTAYDIIEGQDGTWIKGSSNGINITSNGEKNNFTTLLVDNVVVSKDNYVVAEDAMSIILNAEYLKTLDEGKHNVMLQFTNGIAKTSIMIEANKTALSIAIEMAEKANLENVVPVVVTEFNEALANAREVYAKTNATQSEVDSAFTRLASAMQMLEFYQGDKTALQKQVNQINDLDESKYIESSWSDMLAVLEKANDVLVDVNAMQDEVDEAYTELVKAFLNLRLKPNKDLLNDLINKTQGLNAASYSAESWNVLQETLNDVQAVLDDPEATEAEVEAAVTALNSAIEGLAVDSKVPVVNENVTSKTVKSGDTIVSIKTGDTTSLGYSLAGLVLTSMVLAANKKRKK
ncbi:MAG: MBL fold metallo-hydrolase [Thomasclavelia sp.]